MRKRRGDKPLKRRPAIPSGEALLLFCSSCLLFSCLLFSCSLFRPDPVTVDELRDHVGFLSSDELEGRFFGTGGISAAEEYIAGSFREAGLHPFDDDYYQLFSLYATGWTRERPLAVLSSGKENGSVSFFYNLDNFPLPETVPTDGVLESEIVFAGYGIDAPEYEWNDYSGLNVRDKTVLVLRYEPDHGVPGSLFGGAEYTRHATFRVKMETAKKYGAAALLLIDGPLTRGIDKTDPQAPAPGFRMSKRNYYSDLLLPGLHISGEVLKQLLPETDFAGVQEKIDSREGPVRLPPITARMEIVAASGKEGVPGRNVIAYRPSRENRNGAVEDEERIIVIGAHHDHIGTSSPATGEDFIFNGADDNASGVAAVLELAERFSRFRGDTALLFVTFSAEELGLFGSEVLINDFPWIEEKTMLMINLDMIGRKSENGVTVRITGNGSLRERVESLLPEDFSTGYDENNRYLSDSYSFSQKDIPTLSFFTGKHPQYHQPDDEAELLDFQGMKEIADTAAVIISAAAEDPLSFEVRK